MHPKNNVCLELVRKKKKSLYTVTAVSGGTRAVKTSHMNLAIVNAIGSTSQQAKSWERGNPEMITKNGLTSGK